MPSNSSKPENIGLPSRVQPSRVRRALGRAKTIVAQVPDAPIVGTLKGRGANAVLWVLQKEQAEKVQGGLTWLANKTLGLSFATDPTAGALFALMTGMESNGWQPSSAIEIIREASQVQLAGAKLVEGLITSTASEDLLRRHAVARNSFSAYLDVLASQYEDVNAASENLEAVWASMSRPNAGATETAIAVFKPSIDDPLLKAMTLSLTLAANAYISRISIERLPAAFESLADLIRD